MVQNLVCRAKSFDKIYRIIYGFRAPIGRELKFYFGQHVSRIELSLAFELLLHKEDCVRLFKQSFNIFSLERTKDLDEHMQPPQHESSTCLVFQLNLF